MIQPILKARADFSPFFEELKEEKFLLGFSDLYNGLGTVVPNILIVPAVPRVRQLSPTKHLLAKICAHILGQIKSQMIL